MPINHWSDDVPDLQELQQPGEPRHRANGRISARAAVLIAIGLSVALVAVLVVVLTRTGGSSVTPIGTGSTAKRSATPLPTPSAGSDTSAATLMKWGQPVSDEEFDGPLGSDWNVYDGKGHNGNGKRSPDAVSFADGVMTITGDEKGTTAGMAWVPGRKYGRWEGRVRAPASDDTYNALMLLWPDAEDWPVGGEVDFMEMDDPSRQSTKMYLHFGKDNNQDEGDVKVDATVWHNWAVEWTPDHIICYLDGKEWYRYTEKKNLPPRPMHLAIQLDWFPDNGDKNNVQKSTMQVDWVKEYALPGYE